MVNMEGKNITTASKPEGACVTVESKPKIDNISKYFVKDVLSILEDPAMKGKTKIKQVRKRMYEYLQ